MVLERRAHCCRSAGARSHFIPAEDAVSTSSMRTSVQTRSVYGPAFADHDAVGFEQAQDLLWIWLWASKTRA